jgi:predicted nucleic acid-binding protein
MSAYQRAVGLMSRYKLDFEDSIHLATALEYNAGAIYSNDSDFDRYPLKRVFE